METFETPLVVQDATGRAFINPDKVGEQWMALRLDDYPINLAASASARPSGFSVPEDAGGAGDFEIAALVGRSSAPFRIKITEPGSERSAFMNVPIHHNHVFGRGGLPFLLGETILIGAGRLLAVELTNLSTTITNPVRLAAVGRVFTHAMSQDEREERKAWLMDRPTRPFWLGFDDTTESLTADQAGAEAFFSMPSGSHFVADQIMIESTGPFEFALFDGHSGRLLTFGNGTGGNGYIDSRLLGGSGAIPAKMLGTALVAPRRAFRMLMNDLSGATNVIHFTFGGRRLKLPVG